MARLWCLLKGHRWTTYLLQHGPRKYRVALLCVRCKVRPSE